MNEMSPRPDSNGYPHICDHAGSVPNTADIARLWLITRIKMVATKLEVEIFFERREMLP